MDGLTTSQHVAQAACAAFVAVAALLLGVEQVVNDSKGGDGGGDFVGDGVGNNTDADDADDMATRPAPTKEDWSEMLAAQDPYERDVRLPEFTHEVVSVAGISVKMRHGTGAALRDLGTGRVVW